jgi:hypothetical protein
MMAATTQLGNGFSEHEILAGKFTIQEKDGVAVWKEATGEAGSNVHAVATLEILESRLKTLLQRQFSQKESDTQEVELHLQHTLYFLKKVNRHIERNWSWLPLIGWIFANFGKEQARQQFEKTADLLQFYLHRHASHVLQAKKGLLKELKLEKEYNTICRSFERDETLKEFTKEVVERLTKNEVVSKKALQPVPRHIENLFEHGKNYGFCKSLLQSKEEAEERLTQNEGICDAHSNKLLFWRKQEGDEATFHVTLQTHATQKISSYMFLVCERRDSFQYEASSNAGWASQPIAISKELPDFPEHVVTYKAFVLTYDRTQQSKLQHLVQLVTQQH